MERSGSPAPVGSVIRASSSLRCLGLFGVDRDGSDGHYFLRRVRRDAIPRITDDITKLYNTAVDGIKTPRKEDGDVADGKGLQGDVDKVDKDADPGRVPAGRPVQRSPTSVPPRS